MNQPSARKPGESQTSETTAGSGNGTSDANGTNSNAIRSQSSQLSDFELLTSIAASGNPERGPGEPVSDRVVASYFHNMARLFDFASIAQSEVVMQYLNSGTGLCAEDRGLTLPDLEDTIASSEDTFNFSPLEQASETALIENVSNAGAGPNFEIPLVKSNNLDQEENLASRLTLLNKLEASTREHTDFDGRVRAVSSSLPVRSNCRAAASDLPFCRRAKLERNKDETVMNFALSQDFDHYLLDHAIGGFIGTAPNRKAYLLPLMVAVEIMAECALAHLNDTTAKIVRIENCKAMSRILVDCPVQLKVVARGKGSVTVQLFSDANDREPAFECLVIAESDFVVPENALRKFKADTALQGSMESPSVLIEKNSLYRLDRMFHGPLMQSVNSIDGIAGNTISGQVESRQARGWFADNPNEEPMLLHPLLLDNASQLVLFHLFEHGQPVRALLPFYFESIEIYGDLKCLSGALTGFAVLHSITDERTHASVRLYSQSGTPVLSINGIRSRRIMPSPQWDELVFSPEKLFVSTKLESVELRPYNACITTLNRSSLPDENVVLGWCLDYVLTADERLELAARRTRRNNQDDWIVSRIAAKDAVRQWLKSVHGVVCAAADVHIVSVPKGNPAVRFTNSLAIAPPLLSISHSNGFACALVLGREHDLRPGIDCEQIRPVDEEMPSFILTGEEVQLLQQEIDPTIGFIHVWAAKEACYKALGGDSIREYPIESIDSTNERVSLQGPSGNMNAFTKIVGEYMIAFCLATP